MMSLLQNASKYPELYDPTDMCRPTVGQHVTNTLPTHAQPFLPFSPLFTIIYTGNLQIELLNIQLTHTVDRFFSQ